MSVARGILSANTDQREAGAVYARGKSLTALAVPIRPGGTLLRILCVPILGVFAVFITLLGALATLVFLVDLLVFPPFFDLALRILYSGLHYLSCGLRLVLPGPALLIADEYLEDRCSLFTAPRIPWKEVVSAERAEVFVESGVAVHLNDPDAWIRQAPVGQRLFLHLNSWLFHTPVFIPVSCMAITTDELIDTIYAHMGKASPRTDQKGEKPTASKVAEFAS